MNSIKSILLSVFLFTYFSISAFANMPPTYYSGTEDLSGDELKSRLHEIIKNHKEYSYKKLWTLLAYTDEDPHNENNVKLLYTGWSRPKHDHGGDVSQWNREHVWAKSHGGFGKKKPAGTDLHHIRPTDVSVNTKRGHLDFDNGGTIYQDGDGVTQCKFDSDSWEPMDSVKGDVARMIFYMAIRYEGGGNVKDLELADRVSTYPSALHGKLSTLIEWHKSDEVDDWERRRNNRIYELQKNRNPFIDHPEFVNLIWANQGSGGIVEEEHDEIRVGTYNIEWYPYHDWSNNNWVCCGDIDCVDKYKTDENTLWDIIDKTNADLLIVQEIVEPDKFQKFITDKSNGSYSFIYDSSGSGPCQKIGFLYNNRTLEMIGDYERLDSVALDLDGDSKYRPAYHAFFKSKQGGFDFHAIGVHMAGPSGSLELRSAQWRRLGRAIQNTAAKDQDIIIAGDFNAYNNGASFQSILDDLGFFRITDRIPSYCYKKKYSFLDNILISPDVEGQEYTLKKIEVFGPLAEQNNQETQSCINFKNSDYYNTVSDHCPVVATFVDIDNDPQISNENSMLFKKISGSMGYTGPVIGNKRSKIYHHPDSQTLPKESNRIYFESISDAITAGYRAAKNYDWDQ